MSPEQAMGEREITAKSDVYALGCVLYEMLTGEPPFTGPTAQAIIARVMTEEPRSLTLQRKTIPPHVEAAVVDGAGEAAGRPVRDRGAVRRGAEPAGRAPPSSTPAARPAEVAGRAGDLAARALALAPWLLALLALGAAGWAWRQRAPRQGTTWQYITFGDGRGPQDGAALARALARRVHAGRCGTTSRTGGSGSSAAASCTPVPVPGTERSSQPAFSPDGQWISFQADGRLRKIRPGEGGAIYAGRFRRRHAGRLDLA